MFRKTLVALASVALFLTVPGAHANPPMTFTFTDDFILFDPCNGENVHFIGQTTNSVAVSVKNDIAHISFHVIERDDGTGQTTGASYKLNAEINGIENAKLTNGTDAFNNEVTANVIAQGSVPNETIKETFHFTVNANGTVTVNRFSIALDCHG